jgi:hypothetical protein
VPGFDPLRISTAAVVGLSGSACADGRVFGAADSATCGAGSANGSDAQASGRKVQLINNAGKLRNKKLRIWNLLMFEG